MQDIGEFAGVRLGPGSLYGAISRLEERGLIKALKSDTRKKPYRITPAGLAAVEMAVSEMRVLVAEVKSRLSHIPRLALDGGIA
jgi:DNA-binding PadR family transcriptional regulator